MKLVSVARIKIPTSFAKSLWQKVSPSFTWLLQVPPPPIYVGCSPSKVELKAQIEEAREASLSHPLVRGIFSVKLPLTWTLDVVEESKPFTSLANIPLVPLVLGHPISKSVWPCQTLLSAFSKSSFRSKVGILCLITQSTVIHASEMFLRIKCLGMNPICWGQINFLLWGLSHFASSFAISL